MSAPGVLTIGPSLAPADVGALCERLRAIMRDGGVREVVCDVAAVTEPDVTTLQALARLQLTAKRLGGRVVLARPGERLSGLLRLTGFGEILPVAE
ncbi:STAS domain-containing protein [Actinomadura sediminis]|uniref:STAS domain-containing protein n=1 Tax=Actinomadura sediminis TaxID=1038904 RepID=A0ABW3ELD9_9ACTN